MQVPTTKITLAVATATPSTVRTQILVDMVAVYAFPDRAK